MTFSRRLVCVLSLALFTVAGIGHAQQAYHIKLARTRKVGDSYVVTSTCTTHQRITLQLNGSMLQDMDSTYTIYFLANAGVIPGDADDDSPAVVYTVKKCLRYRAADTAQLVAPGNRLVFHMKSGHGKLSDESGIIDAETLRDIGDAIIDFASISADERVGVAKPQRVGGNWKIDPRVAAEGISGTAGGLFVLPKDVSGTGNLVGVSTMDGVPEMTVRIDLTIKNFSMPQLKQMNVKQANALMHYSGDFPLDETKGPLRAALSMNMAMKAKGEQGTELDKMNFDVRFTREAVTQFSYEK